MTCRSIQSAGLIIKISRSARCSDEEKIEDEMGHELCMALTLFQQIDQLIKNKKHILITFRGDATGDAIGSALALFLFLKKQGKTADVICHNFSLPSQFRFLQEADKITGAPSHLQKFILTLDVAEAGVQELSYDLQDEKLRIFVTPKRGFLTRADVRTAQTDFKYDLIMVLDSENLAALGGLYENNTELFFKTPIINLDYRPGNEHFGQVNLIDLTVVSTAEVVFDLLKQLGEEYIDASVSTALLTGLIAQTRSFKSDNIKPHTLTTGAKLMSLGADREKIITNLFRTRSVAALKLWGQALTHLQHDSKIGLVWSTITRDDFVRCGASETDLKDIIDELISNSPEAKFTLLLHEHIETPQTIHGLFRVHTKDHDAKFLLKSFNPVGGKQAVSFKVYGKGLKPAETDVVAHLQKVL